MPSSNTAHAQHLFVGGPFDGQVIVAHIGDRKNQVFRSNIIGDMTIYYHRGLGFYRYYRFLGHWRSESLDKFDEYNGS
jgi:hypothetical protein